MSFGQCINNNNNNNNNNCHKMLKLNGAQCRGKKCPTRIGLNCHNYSHGTTKTRLMFDNSGGNSTSSLFGAKLHHSILIVLLVLAYQITNSPPCQSALLTNIYGGKKLSEITGDISHRFLLISSPNAATRNTINHESQLADLHNYEEHQQQQRQHNLYSHLTLSQQQPHLTTATSETGHPEGHDQLLAPPAAAAVGEQMPSPSPLVTQWRQQQAQPQNNQKSARLMSMQQQQQQQQQQNVSTTNYQLELSTKAVLAGEPVVLESMSTEFPNPNINNLGHEITKILRKFFQHGYDKRVRPNYSGPPALVNVSFHIIGISSVDEVQMDFTTDFYFRQKWFDPRLEFDPVGEIDELCVGAEFAEKIWLPDTFFANEKTALFHKATTENTFIRIGQNGRVYRSIRLTVTCSCPMDLQYFPMDRQRCKIEIESYGYNTRDIDYRWERGDDSVSLNTKIELPQFKILGFKMGQEIQNLSSGDYIRLYCEIHFVRSMGYYLFQIYIPASLIVMISWVSFWLHRNATPARVALGVTTVLTMTTLMSSTNAALPKISYIKSIDVFLGTCFVMVFAALLEYASVGYIGKRIAMKRKRLQDLQQMQQHHQKVCVAAAASAAAAAAAAQQQQDQASLFNQLKGSNLTNSPSGRTQTIHRRSIGGNLMKMMQEGSKTLQRSSRVSLGQGYQGIDNGEPNLFGHRPSFKSPLENGGNARLNPNSPTVLADQTGGKTPLLAAGAAIAAAAAANQHTHGSTTEFEVNQTHDMIRICGLTPSSIDKHSRVVFPICFVCFNLMYWIIYGHISQQIEDKGPPLIPFIKN